MGSERSWYREQLYTQLYRKASLTEDGASHLSRTIGTNLEVVISPSWLDEGCCNLYEPRCHTLPTNISPEPRSQPDISPREPRGQAMAASCGSCRGRALRRRHVLHLVRAMSSHVHPCPRGPPACSNAPRYEETLPAPIGCRKSRSSWAVRFCFTIVSTLGHIFSSSKNHVQGGNARNLFDLTSINSKADDFPPSVPMPFLGS